MQQQNGKQDNNPSKTIDFPKHQIMISQYQTMVLNHFFQKLTNNKKNKHSPHNKNTFIFPKFSQTDIKNDPPPPPKQIPNNQHSFYETKSIFLPSLKNRSNPYHQKIIVNETVYIHERVPITTNNQGNDKTITKQHSLDQKSRDSWEEQNKRKKIISNYAHSKSMNKVNDMEIIQFNFMKENKGSKTNVYSPKKTILRQKSIQKIIKVQTARQAQKGTSEVQDDLITQGEVSTDLTTEQLKRRKSRIQRLLMNYKNTKQKIKQKCANSQKNILINSLQEQQRIAVKGKHTIHIQNNQKRKNSKKQKNYSNINKPQYHNWKIKALPFLDLPKLEAHKLFCMYLNVKEVVPAAIGYYRVFVGQGNNGPLIARCLKNKGWWLPTEDISEANLIWTQLPNEEQMKKLTSQNQIMLKIVRNEVFNECQPAVKQKIKQFLQLKDNNFFDACRKIIHPCIYNKIVNDFAVRFKQNKYVKNYMFLKDMISKHYKKSNTQLKVDAKSLKVVNHCQYSNQIGDKKKLFFHIQKYCQINDIPKQNMIPQTIHINQQDIESIKGSNSQQKIQQKLKALKDQAMYILKPGECTNRGHGITVHPNKSILIQHISRSLQSFPQNKTFIVQQYIDPLLYDGRKFDIRVWALYSNNRVWFYRQGYVRTSCKEYTVKSMNKYIHLTNDAVQKHAQDYGKYEPANKVSFADLDKYLKKSQNYEGFYSQIYQNIKLLTKRLFEAGTLVIGKSCNQFELFGLDFLLDSQFKVWLIECNTNPSIQICCSLLNRLVPNMIQNVITVTVDPFFPPNQKRAIRQQNEWANDKFNFQLMLDATQQTRYLQKILKQDQPYFQQLKAINSHKLGAVELLEQQNQIVSQIQPQMKVMREDELLSLQQSQMLTI